MSVGADQLSFDDFFAEAPAERVAPQRLLDPAEVARRCGLSYAPFGADNARCFSRACITCFE